MNSYARHESAALNSTADIIRVPDALVLLKASHRQIEDQFETYAKLAQAVKKQACVEAIRTSLTIHISLLTLHFHPAVTFVFENPAEFSRQSIVKYAKFKELLLELEQSPSIGDRAEKVEQLRKHFQQHVKEEETVVFPRLRRSPLNLGELGETLYRAKESLESDINARVEKKIGFMTLKAPISQHGATFLRH